MKDSNFHRDHDRSRPWIVASVWIVLLIGLPIWWKTTTVHRANLHLSRIAALEDFTTTSLVFHIPVSISSESSKIDIPQLCLRANTQLKDLQSQLRSFVESKRRIRGRSLSYELHLISSQSEVQYIRNESQQSSPATSSYNLVIEHYPIQKPPKRPFELLPNRLGKLWIREGSSEDSIADAVVFFVWSNFGAEWNYLSSFLDAKDAPPGAQSQIAEAADYMRAFRSSSDYELSFTLLNADQAGRIFSWDIKDAISEYFSGFLQDLSSLSRFHIDSQVQNYGALAVEPLRNENGYYLTPEILPYIWNSQEWNLAPVSQYPTLNFILFFSSAKHYPIRIVQSDGQALDTNAFLIPRVGGVIIDPPFLSNTSDARHRLSKHELKPILEIFAQQLRSLIGFVPNHIPISQKLDAFDGISLPIDQSFSETSWDLERLYRRRMALGTWETVDTLKKFISLVDRISSMVVPDRIGELVKDAVSGLEKAWKEPSKEQNLSTRQALVVLSQEKSELAFFDAGVLELLYFPDEHKYAVYAPLFLPIIPPLIVATRRVLTRSSKKVKSE